MTDLFDWLIHIPQYVGEFGTWLTSPISDQFAFSPLAIVGASAVVAVAAIVVMKVIHLVNPFG